MDLTKEQAKYAKRIDFEHGKVYGDIRENTEAIPRSNQRILTHRQKGLLKLAGVVTGIGLAITGGVYAVDNLIHSQTAAAPEPKPSPIEIVVSQGEPITNVLNGEISVNKGVHFRTGSFTEDVDTDDPSNNIIYWNEIKSINGVSLEGVDGFKIKNPTAVLGEYVGGYNPSGNQDYWAKVEAELTNLRGKKMLYLNLGESTKDFVSTSGNWTVAEKDQNGIFHAGAIDEPFMNQTAAITASK